MSQVNGWWLMLTHWGRVTHICVSKLTIIASYNGLSPGRRQAIIWTNAGILSIGLLGTNFSDFLIEILTFSFKRMRLKMPSAKWRLLRLGLNELKAIQVNPSPKWKCHEMKSYGRILPRRIWDRRLALCTNKSKRHCLEVLSFFARRCQLQ